MSVIVPGQDKGKSYIEHPAVQTGTSYKAKLKAAIDHLIPASSDIEDLLAQLQREGYEIKRGKNSSARAPNQERFTRLKTLGADYTEEAITARIAGGLRPSRQLKQRDGRASLLIDIQNNIKAQQNAGYHRWATIEAAARAIKTSGIDKLTSSEKLQTDMEALTARKTFLQAEYQKAKKEEREYDTLRHNVDMLLAIPQEQQRQRSNDLESQAWALLTVFIDPLGALFPGWYLV